MPAKSVHHIDLAVSDVERSLAFYLDLLGPLGWRVTRRYPTYRGTEEVIYLGTAEPNAPYDDGGLGLRPADGGVHQYYGVGIEHIAFEADTTAEVDDAYARATSFGAKIHFPPEEDRDEPGYYAFFAFDPDGIRVEVFSWTSSAGVGAGRVAQALCDRARVAASASANCFGRARRIGSFRPLLHASSSSSVTSSKSARSDGLGTRSQSSTNSRSASSADPAAPPVPLGSCGYSLPAGCANACVR